MLCPCRMPQCMVRPRASVLSPRVRPLNMTPKTYLQKHASKKTKINLEECNAATRLVSSYLISAAILTVYCSGWRCSLWVGLLPWGSSHYRCWPWLRWSTGGEAGCDRHPGIEVCPLVCPSTLALAGMMSMIHCYCEDINKWKHNWLRLF